MRRSQCRDHVCLPLFREDRLEPQLSDTLLAPRFPDRRARSLPAEKRARPLRVPGAMLVLADAPGTRLEEGAADGVERLARNEDDELAVQISVSICAFCSLPLKST